MGFVGMLAKGVGAGLVVVIAGAAGYLYMSPPELLRVGAGYAAKIGCSNVFIAGRDLDVVVSDDVQAPGNPILKLVTAKVDKERARVAVDFLGFIAPRYAVYRPGFGCTVLDGGPDEAANLPTLPKLDAIAANDPALEWPDGEAAEKSKNAAVSELLGDPALTGPGMRAVVVVQHGRIIAETYGAGFGPETPLIGWSMTKTVNGVLAGLAEKRGALRFEDQNLFAIWKGDGRGDISLGSLAAMQSGLRFNEDYGDVSDVTRMLYLEPDMAGYVTGMPLDNPPDTNFNYSTGTAVAISRYWQDKIGEGALSFPHDALFAPLGLSSAVLETDTKGTFVGGSYLYADAHDWARLGQFLLQDGVWNGERLLSEDFMRRLYTPTQVSDGDYTQVQAWYKGPDSKRNDLFGLPAETLWMKGHDGQSTAIVPSADLVVLRMGLTPSRLHYQPQRLLKRILDTLEN